MAQLEPRVATPALTIRDHRRQFWRQVFADRGDAVRWWTDLMAAFGASVPEAVSYAERWADDHGYVVAERRRRRASSWEVRG